MTVGLAVAGNGGPGFEAQALSCTSAPASLAVGCEDAEETTGEVSAAPGTHAQGDAPPASPPGGLPVSEDWSATAGTGTGAPTNGQGGGDDDDDEGAGGDRDDGDGEGEGEGEGDGNGDGEGDGNGNGNGDGDGKGDGDGDGNGDGDPAAGLSSSATDPLFSLPNLAAGKTVERCISITYVGEDPATVGLHATKGGSGLDEYLDVEVVRGQMTPSAPGDCTGFDPDAADHSGEGSGVLYRDRLRAFPAVASNGLSAGGVWRSGETHAYKITLSVASGDAAQGRSVFFDFVWSAQS